MERGFITVSFFCLLCAAHSHCSAHGDIHNTHSTGRGSYNNDDGSGDGGGGGNSQTVDLSKESGKQKQLAVDNKPDSNTFVSKVFEKFGDGKTISQEGFKNFLCSLQLGRRLNYNSGENDNAHPYTNKIVSSTDAPPKHITLGLSSITDVRIDLLVGASQNLTKESYKEICPILLYQFVSTSQSPLVTCSSVAPKKMVEHTKHIYAVWLYATLSILVISLCGLGGVIVIPVMQKVFYQQLLQFLVALAVGTLCGDALLHLLPHAMMSSHSHSSQENGSGFESLDHDYDSHSDVHDTNMWRGLVAMFGIIFLYFTEKGLTMIADWRKRRQRKQTLPKVRVMRDTGDGNLKSDTAVGEKLCKHKYSSYPYCYAEITENSDGQTFINGNRDLTNETKQLREDNGGILDKTVKNYSFPVEKTNGVDSIAVERELLNEDKEVSPGEPLAPSSEESYTVIIREHENVHHGHSHQHGHVHAAPTSLSSVAWMVIMGDGLHNFADGMAIGAAFATNISGGFSTALAVFFHELPHELGDFAVLLQAGMSAKQAIFYNMLSSVLCLVGMCLGVFLGHDEATTQWVFSAAAGMFLYIALVDMIPELTSSHSKEGSSLCQCALQFGGLISGVGTMLLIALYEDQIKSIFVD